MAIPGGVESLSTRTVSPKTETVPGELRVALRRRPVRDEPAEATSVTSDRVVRPPEEPCRGRHAQMPDEPGERRTAREALPVRLHQVDRAHPLRLRDARQERLRLAVLEAHEGDPFAAVETHDGTRDEPAEAAVAVIE